MGFKVDDRLFLFPILHSSDSRMFLTLATYLLTIDRRTELLEETRFFYSDTESAVAH
jgi:hypothetical protein